MKKIILFTILAIIISLSLKAQKIKPLKVKVEFIEKMENGYEVWVKWHNPHYRHRDFHLVRTFVILPPDIKRDAILYLYPSKDSVISFMPVK